MKKSLLLVVIALVATSCMEKTYISPERLVTIDHIFEMKYIGQDIVEVEEDILSKGLVLINTERDLIDPYTNYRFSIVYADVDNDIFVKLKLNTSEIIGAMEITIPNETMCFGKVKSIMDKTVEFEIEQGGKLWYTDTETGFTWRINNDTINQITLIDLANYSK